jgi:glycosyltransferase involved in cell wall biosynthesis
MRIIQYVHEMSLGGGSVHVCQLLKDFKALGHDVAYATLQDGIMRGDLEASGVPIFLLGEEKDLIHYAGNWGAHVLHGHTCGGGSYACKVARELGAVGGETIHSFVAGQNPEADFEIVELDSLGRLRPKADVIYWAIHQDRFRITKSRDRIRSELGIPVNAFVMGRNGRLAWEKAPDEFVRCLASLKESIPNIWGLMVGEGAEFDNLKQLACQLGCVERLVMPGMRRDQGNLFHAMDVVVYPTRDESVCAGVLEPLFVKKPVVAYLVGGMHETIIHNETGLAAPTFTHLVYSVEYLYNYPDEGKRLGEAGYEYVLKKGQMDTVAEAKRHLEVYQRELGRKRAPSS